MGNLEGSPPQKCAKIGKGYFQKRKKNRQSEGDQHTKEGGWEKKALRHASLGWTGRVGQTDELVRSSGWPGLQIRLTSKDLKISKARRDTGSQRATSKRRLTKRKIEFYFYAPHLSKAFLFVRPLSKALFFGRLAGSPAIARSHWLRIEAHEAGGLGGGSSSRGTAS